MCQNSTIRCYGYLKLSNDKENSHTYKRILLYKQGHDFEQRLMK
jgi:hypothetical protein